jgi:hypothetical protein
MRPQLLEPAVVSEHSLLASPARAAGINTSELAAPWPFPAPSICRDEQAASMSRVLATNHPADERALLFSWSLKSLIGTWSP